MEKINNHFWIKKIWKDKNKNILHYFLLGKIIQIVMINKKKENNISLNKNSSKKGLIKSI